MPVLIDGHRRIELIIALLRATGPLCQIEIAQRLEFQRTTVSAAMRRHRERQKRWAGLVRIRLSGFETTDRGQLTPVYEVSSKPDFEPTTERESAAIGRLGKECTAPRSYKPEQVLTTPARLELLREIDVSIAALAPRLAANRTNPFATAMVQVTSP